jgi:hypothetical protein
MTPKLPNDLSQALAGNLGAPLEVEDPRTQTVYVLLSREEFQRMLVRRYDDGDLSADEMLAAAARNLEDPEGWGAPGMDVYDRVDPTQPDCTSS